MEFTVNEQRIIAYIEERKVLSSLEEMKLVYGLRVVIREAKKAFVIYGISLMLGVFFQLLIVQLGFLAVRQVAYGLHCTSFKSCLVISSILFPFLTWVTVHSTIPPSGLWFIFFASLIVLVWLGPTSSAKTKVRGKVHLQFLRKKMYARLMVVGLLLLFIPSQFGVLLVAGMAMAAALVVLAKYI